MPITALIPARGGSKGIFRKNIKDFCSKPLIYWSINIALKSKFIERVIVSTEDKEIAEIAKTFSAEVPFLRPHELSKDDTDGIDPVLHTLNEIPEIDDLLLLQPTSPLRREEDIEAIIKMRDHFKTESAVSITKAQKNLSLFFNLDSQKKLKPITKSLNIKPRQLYPNEYVLNGSMYLSTRRSIIESNSLITSETIGYEMSSESSIDIDTNFDWQIAEYFMRKNL